MRKQKRTCIKLAAINTQISVKYLTIMNFSVVAIRIMGKDHAHLHQLYK